MTGPAAKRIAIVGGGIAGVATAYELTRLNQPSKPTRPCEVTLFEASDRLGGIVETVRRDGFVVECGPDSWVTEKPWARELAIELGLEDRIIASNDARRRTYILGSSNLDPGNLLNGRLVAMPDGMRMMVPTDLDALSGSPLFSDEALRAYAAEPGRSDELKAMAPDMDESVATFVRRHFGEEVAVKIAGPLLSGVFGGSIETLSVRSVMPAFVQMEREHGSLIAGLQARQREPGSRARSSIFTSLKTGLGTLVDSMTGSMTDSMSATGSGPDIRLNEPVLSVGWGGRGWMLRTASGGEEFDAIVMATPAHVSRDLLAPIHPRFGNLLDIEATSAIVVAFAFSAEQASDITIPSGFGFLVPQNGGARETGPSLLACTFVDQKFSHRAPPGAALLRAFFGGDSAPALLGKSDDSLSALARLQLSAILGRLPEPAFTVVRRWPKSLPQYAVGHQARVAELDALVAALSGLHLAGNTYNGVGLPDLIRDARALVRRLVQ